MAAAGYQHSLVVLKDGRLFTFGRNTRGQLGDGTEEDRASPVQVPDNVLMAAAGWKHSLVVLKDGRLFTFGGNVYGQLGDGTTEKRVSPVQVLDNVLMAAAGWEHSLVVLKDGRLLTFGKNTCGQLGDGTTEDRASPVEVLDNVLMAAAGREHSLVVLKDGRLFTFGRNVYGQLGDGTTEHRARPVQVLDNVLMAAAGYQHSLVVLKDGRLFTFGWNTCGQLGDGTTEDRASPVQVLDNVLMAAAGFQHSLVVLKDGRLLTFGDNRDGQLGDGTTEMRVSPVQIFKGQKVQACTTVPVAEGTVEEAPPAASRLQPDKSIVTEIEYRPLANFVDNPPAHDGDLKTCSEYVLTKCMAVMPECIMLSESVREVSRITSDKLQDPAVRTLLDGAGVSQAMLFAVILYTFDLCCITPTYLREQCFYFALNKYLRERSGAFLQECHGFLYYLMTGLQRLPSFDDGNATTLYRGIDSAGATKAKETYIDSRRIHWSGFSSATPNVAVALGFAGPGGLLLRIKTLKNGSRSRDIRLLSALRCEDEILLLPNFTMYVNNEAEFDAAVGCEVIDLKERTNMEVEVF